MDTNMADDVTIQIEVGAFENAKWGTCGEVGDADQEMQCPKSKRVCGHHCNCVWTHDDCCWCGKDFWLEENQSDKENKLT